MSFPKATDEDKARFVSLVPPAAEVTVKPMFGNVAAFIGGRMFMGSFGGQVGVKLSEADRARLAELPGTGPFGPPERPMSGYVTLPAQWGPTEAEPWVALALEQAAVLPPKAPKQPKQLKDLKEPKDPKAAKSPRPSPAGAPVGSRKGSTT